MAVSIPIAKTAPCNAFKIKIRGKDNGYGI